MVCKGRGGGGGDSWGGGGGETDGKLADCKLAKLQACYY